MNILDPASHWPDTPAPTQYCTDEGDCRSLGGGTVHVENGLVRCLGCGGRIDELHNPERHTVCDGAQTDPELALALSWIRAWARTIAMACDLASNEELAHAQEHFRLLSEFQGPDSIDAKFAHMVTSEIEFRKDHCIVPGCGAPKPNGTPICSHNQEA